MNFPAYGEFWRRTQKCPRRGLEPYAIGMLRELWGGILLPMIELRSKNTMLPSLIGGLDNETRLVPFGWGYAVWEVRKCTC